MMDSITKLTVRELGYLEENILDIVSGCDIAHADWIRFQLLKRQIIASDEVIDYAIQHMVANKMIFKVNGYKFSQYIFAPHDEDILI